VLCSFFPLCLIEMNAVPSFVRFQSSWSRFFCRGNLIRNRLYWIMILPGGGGLQLCITLMILCLTRLSREVSNEHVTERSCISVFHICNLWRDFYGIC
jgi:hypothetical protein